MTRTHLADVVAGEPPPRDVIERGAPYRGIEPAPALVLYQQQPDLYVLDVRTPAEFNAGHIPRAHSIPLDELEDRLGELPPRDRARARDLRGRRARDVGVRASWPSAAGRGS